MNSPKISHIGKYEVRGVLGRGGMGLVYHAFDKQLGREVAIKTITESFVGDAEMLARFYREASKTATLKHRNIVTVYDLGEEGGFPYIVMEYVSGEPLDKLIGSDPPLPLAFMLRIIEQVCDALGYAHQNDIIHRDVKPANVIVQPDGIAKLLDFGIARQQKLDASLTRTGALVGTISYMAPERLRNRPFDGRSDIFSAGIMLYQVVTGRLPFTGGEYEVVHKLLNEKHPPLSDYLHDYPAALDAILDQSLAKDPRVRYSTANEMAAELRSVAEALRKKEVDEMFQQAGRLAADQDYVRAREILLQLFKLDSQHGGARQLMAVVQQNIALRQRSQQLQQLRSEAEDAIRERQYDHAISALEQALKLDPSSSESAERLDLAREKRRKNAQIENFLKQANGAKEMGDLEAAQSMIKKALELDKDDSRVRAAYSALVQQVEEATRRAKLRKLLEAARNEMSGRRYPAAIQILQEAEQIDPANAESLSLLQAARSGYEQSERRRTLDQVQNEVALAVTPEQIQRAAELVDETLGRMPSEPTLLKLKAQMDRQITELQTRRLVDAAVQRCRELIDDSPQEALEFVSEQLRACPGDERLLVLRSSIVERLTQRKLDDVRGSYMERARAALSHRQFQEAVKVLESCVAEGIFSDEIAELLDYARREAEQQQRRVRADKSFVQAQTLMAEGAYDAVVALLQPALEQVDEPPLRALLEKAQIQREILQRKIDAVMETIQKFTNCEQYEAAVSLLELQPQLILQSPQIQAALQAARAASERDRAVLQAIAASYAALDRRDIALACSGLQAAAASPAVSPLTNRILPMFEGRRTSIADRALSSAIEQSRTDLRAGNVRLAHDALRAVSSLTVHANSELRTEWRRFRKKVAVAKLLARFGVARRQDPIRDSRE